MRNRNVATITLRCRHCGRTLDYGRDIDPGITANVAVIELTCCDECDNGDFGVETWLDAKGKEVSQDEEFFVANVATECGTCGGVGEVAGPGCKCPDCKGAGKLFTAAPMVRRTISG